VIPTLNEAGRIERQLALLANQTYAPNEIIVCDGGSTDGTVEIVRGIWGEVSNVLLLEVERGTARQRNAGGRAATGEVIIFSDADNLPAATFVEHIALSYQKWPFAVACPWFVARESNAIRAAYFGFNILFLLGQGWLRTGSGVCIITPRFIFEKTGGFAEEMHLGEDVHYIRRAAKYGWHRHLLIPLQTSGRRFQEKGVLKLLWFYACISPAMLLGFYRGLKNVPYESTPYDTSVSKHKKNK
jgi:glycosyltransferase involved in cell wall biosynthesis